MIASAELAALLDHRAALVLLMALRCSHPAGEPFPLARADAQRFHMGARTFIDARATLVRRGFLRRCSASRGRHANGFELVHFGTGSNLHTTD